MFEEIRINIAGKWVSVLIETESMVNAKLLSRPPCLVVGLSSHYHDKFSKAFCSFYKLILVDLYWTDKQFSSEYTDKLEMNMLSDHIEQIREQLEDQLGDEYRKIFVLGHSAYGFISLDYGLKYPEHVLGIINIASPLIFNNELSLKWQEEYIDSNLGSSQAGGPTARWHAYYEKKSAISKEKPDQSKQYFVSSYLSKGPLFFNNPILWQNQGGLAEKMWDPWQISIFDRKTKTVRSETRDVNMRMISRYVVLLTNKDCYSKIPQLQVPMLWVISLGDLRISLYQLEDKRGSNLSRYVEFFHPADASHWPMFSADTNTREFDNKLINWGNKVLELCCDDRPRMTSRL